MALVPQTNTIIFVFVRLFPLIDLSYTAASTSPSRGEVGALAPGEGESSILRTCSITPIPLLTKGTSPLKGEGNPFPKKLYN